MNKEEFESYIELSLDKKILLSKKIIKEFIQENNKYQMYISCSFGKDSLVLVDLVRDVCPEIPIVYINTGLEHESCVSLSKEYDNVYTIKPKKTMKEIIEKYGYITPYGKEISGAIEQVRRNLYEGKCDTYRVKQFRGEIGYSYSKFVKDLLAPFKISDKCCYHLKISPLRTFCKKNDLKYSFVGINFEESSMRKKNLIKDGLNTEKQSRPLGFWKTNDIFQYILNKNIKLPECYGEIIQNGDTLTTSLHKRNGCVCCPIWTHEENPNKFQIFYKKDKKTWEYVINELNFKKVLDWFDVKYK